jgi:hypothetical protein
MKPSLSARFQDASYPNHLRADLGDGLVLGKRNPGQEWAVAGDGGVRVALDVCAPFPAGGIGVTGSDVLCLEALELLLVAKLVGLLKMLDGDG